jgi:hypothetical protein
MSEFKAAFDVSVLQLPVACMMSTGSRELASRHIGVQSVCRWQFEQH